MIIRKQSQNWNRWYDSIHGFADTKRGCPTNRHSEI